MKASFLIRKKWDVLTAWLGTQSSPNFTPGTFQWVELACWLNWPLCVPKKTAMIGKPYGAMLWAILNSESYFGQLCSHDWDSQLYPCKFLSTCWSQVSLSSHFFLYFFRHLLYKVVLEFKLKGTSWEDGRNRERWHFRLTLYLPLKKQSSLWTMVILCFFRQAALCTSQWFS